MFIIQSCVIFSIGVEYMKLDNCAPIIWTRYHVTVCIKKYYEKILI